MYMILSATLNCQEIIKKRICGLHLRFSLIDFDIIDGAINITRMKEGINTLLTLLDSI